MADGEDRALAEAVAADILKEDAAGGGGADQEAAALLAAQEAAAQEAATATAAAEAEKTAAAEGAPAQTEAEQAAAAEALAKTAAEAGKKKKIEPLPKWMSDRLAEQTAKQRDAERLATEAEARATAAIAEAEELRRRLATAGGADPAALPAATPGSPGTPPAGYVPATEVDKLAAQKASETAFNEKANAAYYAGKAAYEDFDDALQPLNAMGIIGRRDFQEAAIATGSAPDVIYHLGTKPDEANKILGLLKSGNAVAATAELTKISMQLEGEKTRAKAAAAKNVSQAPAPIRAVGGSALPALDLEKADDDTFTDELNKKARANGWW